MRKHGHDTYGDNEDSDTAELKPKERKRDKMVEGQCKCGSKPHLWTSHECPYNKKILDVTEFAKTRHVARMHKWRNVRF